MRAKKNTLNIQKQQQQQDKERQTVSAHGIELSPVRLKQSNQEEGAGDTAPETEIMAVTHHKQMKVLMCSTKATEVENFNESNDIIR